MRLCTCTLHYTHAFLEGVFVHGVVNIVSDFTQKCSGREAAELVGSRIHASLDASVFHACFHWTVL